MDAPSSASERDPLERLAAEFLDRRRRGDDPSPADYARRHPELAEQILEFFPALEVMEGLKPGSGDRTDSFNGESGATVTPRMERLGEFRILREIGHGGMGVVYEAVQESLGRRVALKILPLHGRIDPVQIERFRLESRSAARLHHGHIVPVYGMGEHEGVYYYAMQYIQGHGLDVILDDLRRLRDGEAPPGESSDRRRADTGSMALARSLVTGRFTPVSPGSDPVGVTATATCAASQPHAEASHLSSNGDRSAVLSSPTGSGYYRTVARLGVQVAGALAHAHGQGVLHRDIKPSNLLLDAAGHVWVADFGLAKLEGSEGPTQTGDIVGTLRYMAPERFEGWSDRRSDLYGLGMTLYELLTLRPAFEAATRAKLIERVLHDPPAAPRKLDPRIPRDLETIVCKAIAKEPWERYATAEALATDLENFLADRPIVARRSGLPERAWRWCRRNKAAAGLLAASGIASLALVGLFIGFFLHTQLQEAFRGVQQARDLADRARGAEQEQRQEAERNLYFKRFVLAEREWSTNNVGRAEQLLDECPADLRGWEWHYLKRLCHTDLRSLRADASYACGVAFSPDGLRLASAHADGTVRTWDVASGRPGMVLRGHAGQVWDVAFSPDGRRIVSVSGEGSSPGDLIVWDAASGADLRKLPGFTGFYSRLAISPDGRWIAAASGNGRTPGEVKVWDAATGREQSTFNRHKGEVIAVAFSPDSTRVASASGTMDSLAIEKLHGEVKVWDAMTGGEQWDLSGHEGPVNGLSFSPDGRLLASASWDGTVRIWDPTTGRGRLTFRGHADSVDCVTFSPDGPRIASAAEDGAIKLWDATTGQELRTFRGHVDPVVRIAFSPDGRLLASASQDGTVKIWDSRSEQGMSTLRGHAAWVTHVTFSPDGRLLASASVDRSVKLWDAGTGREIRTLHGHIDPVWCTTFCSGGSSLASCGGYWRPVDRPGAVKLWDSRTGRELPAPDVETDIVWRLASSPDGRLLASASGEAHRPGVVKLWEVQTGHLVATLSGHGAGALSVAFSPDGHRLASSSWDGTVRVWDPESGRELRVLLGHNDHVYDVAFSPDGTRLASASEDNTIRIWDPATGREALPPLLGHTNGISGVVYSPDGTRIASAGWDKTVRLWDSATGQELLALRGHAAPVWSVAFSPDGQRIASASQDGTVKIWDATHGPGADAAKAARPPTDEPH